MRMAVMVTQSPPLLEFYKNETKVRTPFIFNSTRMQHLPFKFGIGNLPQAKPGKTWPMLVTN